jgi:hypothetical protein
VEHQEVAKEEAAVKTIRAQETDMGASMWL